ncbi:allantoate permease [Cryptococcus neoformans]|nr:allantoate permease [Cryptococcus neoformans var. grubii c45]OXB37774.1 allantoate permease [Cryptococcus neoformans var. grubii]OXC62081.1 allantoate permease [Cryptococcus neoformans var. grubii MW-RSA852]
MSFSEKDNEKVLVDSYPPVRVVSASDNATQRVARDIAADLVAELDAGFEVTPEMKRRVLRKIDFILLPLISCTATLSFLDKVSNNYANNYGLQVGLGMHGTQFSWSASVFYFAFLIWQPAVSYMTQHFPLGKLVSINCICWGLVLLGQGFVKNYAGFMVLRFFQGIFEACVLPSFLVMCSIYWTREEQSFRSAFWFNSCAGILGGLFAYAMGHFHPAPGYSLYQYIYIVYGSFTTGWGVMLFFALPDSPVTAWFFSHEERLTAVARVKGNNTGMINRHFDRSQMWEALLDPKTWWFFLFTFVCNIPNGGLNAFSTAIIKGFGFTTLETTLMSVPWGVVCTLGNGVIGLCISYTMGKRLFLMAFAIIPPIIGTVVMYTIPHSNKAPSLFAYYITGFYNAPYVMSLALMASNTAGTTKKSVTSAIIWMSYCGGNIAGPFFYRSKDAPTYQFGTAALLTCFSLQVVLALLFRVYLLHLNRQKELAFEPSEHDESAQHAFADLTDKQNTDFRYTY